MGRVQDAICDALVAEIKSRQEWDQPPEVLTVYYRGGEGHLGRLPLPAAIWSSGPPAQILASLADAGGDCAGLLQRLVPPEFYGMAFFSEIWMVSAPEGTAEADDLLRRAEAAGGRVSQMPERVEARSMWAVDRAGTTYSAVRARGSDEVKRGLIYTKPGRSSAGTIPAALDRMVTAFLGVSMPDRTRT
jgi:hypothetical protein